MSKGDIEIYKPTQDDWYPNFENNTVQLSLLNLGNNTYRVCSWGNDDFGMELDFETLGEAEYIFDILNKKEFINKEDLKKMGFQYA